MAELTLYNYWRSSSSYRVRIALELKGLPYRYVAVNLLAGEQSSPEYLARSPTGYVPCLVVDGVSYTESVAIIEMLDERFPSSKLYPEAIHARARVRALVQMIGSGIQPLQNLNVLQFVSSEADGQRRWFEHFVTRGLAAVDGAMQALEQEGIRGRYAYGDTPTAVDVFLVPQVVAAQRFQVDVSRFPRVARAFEEAMKLDAFQKAAPNRQPDAVQKP